MAEWRSGVALSAVSDVTTLGTVMLRVSYHTPVDRVGSVESGVSRPLSINATLTIPGAELEWSATRASGPGGQNVNKVSSKVELRFDFEGSPLLDAMTKSRLRVLGKSQLDAEGRLRIASQLTRDQGRNLEDARAKLCTLVLRALERPKARRPTKPGRRANARRLDAKEHNSAKKRDRRVDSKD